MRFLGLPTNADLNALIEWVEQLRRNFNSISFGDGTNRSEAQNLDLVYVTGTTNAVPGTETTHSHLLERIPIGFIVISQDKAGTIYNSNNANTDSLLKVKSDIASITFKAIVF